MSTPDFDPIRTLGDHWKILQRKAVRTSRLITTIDNTIEMMKGFTYMAEKELFMGFDEERYADEAKSLWGETDRFKESQKRWSSYSKSQQRAIKEEGAEITARMVDKSTDKKPDDDSVQEAIGEYLAYINKYFYPCDPEFLRSLSEMWVTDARFAVNYERIREGGAALLKEAMGIFCDRKKQ